MPLDPRAFEQRAQHLFGFEELPGDFACAARVPGIVGVDSFHSFSDSPNDWNVMGSWRPRRRKTTLRVRSKTTGPLRYMSQYPRAFHEHGTPPRRDRT